MMTGILKTKTGTHIKNAIMMTMTLVFMAFFSIYPDFESDSWASEMENQENYTHKLTQSNSDYVLWTTPPSERVFKIFGKTSVSKTSRA